MISYPSQAINFIGLLPIVRPPVESPEVSALEEILQSRDLAIAIQGPAGAGKTTFAAEAVRAIEALSGKDVMVLAPVITVLLTSYARLQFGHLQSFLTALV
jgi:superfamily II DNA or RNA helicase